MQAEVNAHQNKRPMRQREVSLPDDGACQQTVHKRCCIAAHHHAGQRCTDKCQQQQGIDDQLEDSQRRVLAFEDRGVILSVENVVEDRQRKHGDTDPLVRELLCHLHGHQQQESNR